jgi:tetratricopeptide (TPR) repeat protein
MPDDVDAQQGKKMAEAKLLAQGDKKKRQDNFDTLVKRGKDALAEKRYKAAITNLELALRIIPDDKEAKQTLDAAKKGLKDGKENAKKLLARAKELVSQGRLTEAKSTAEDAKKELPEDPEGEKLAKLLIAQVANLLAVQATYTQLVQAGFIAYQAGRYADAVKSYTAALQINPDDVDTALALKNAQRALAKTLKPILEAKQYIALGTQALARKDWSAAASASRQALRRVPDDATALDGLSQAKYGGYMANGQAALNARQKAAAIKAFQLALNEKPGDYMASNGLRSAQWLK